MKVVIDTNVLLTSLLNLSVYLPLKISLPLKKDAI